MKTREKVEELKENWLEDPCWDIEETNEFEEYYDELLAFRIEKEHEWKKLEQWRLEQKAISLGMPGNIQLAKYIEYMEDQIRNLQDEVFRLKYNK